MILYWMVLPAGRFSGGPYRVARLDAEEPGVATSCVEGSST